MLWIILGVAVIVAVLITVSLCKTAGLADEHNDNAYQAIYRGDGDGYN